MQSIIILNQNRLFFKAEYLLRQSMKRSRLNPRLDPGTVIYDYTFQRKGLL